MLPTGAVMLHDDCDSTTGSGSARVAEEDRTHRAITDVQIECSTRPLGPGTPTTRTFAPRSGSRQTRRQHLGTDTQVTALDRAGRPR